MDCLSWTEVCCGHYLRAFNELPFLSIKALIDGGSLIKSQLMTFLKHNSIVGLLCEMNLPISFVNARMAWSHVSLSQALAILGPLVLGYIPECSSKTIMHECKKHRNIIENRDICLTIYRGWKKSISPSLRTNETRHVAPGHFDSTRQRHVVWTDQAVLLPNHPARSTTECVEPWWLCGVDGRCAPAASNRIRPIWIWHGSATFETGLIKTTKSNTVYFVNICCQAWSNWPLNLVLLGFFLPIVRNPLDFAWSLGC